MNSENLKKLDVSLASLESKIKDNKDKISKASMDDKDEMMKMMGMMYDDLYNMANSLRSSIYTMDDTMYKHKSDSSVHLPGFTPGQLKKLVENCGASDDYQIMPRPVYASRAKALEVSYKK